MTEKQELEFLNWKYQKDLKRTSEIFELRRNVEFIASQRSKQLPSFLKKPKMSKKAIKFMEEEKEQSFIAGYMHCLSLININFRHEEQEKVTHQTPPTK